MSDNKNQKAKKPVFNPIYISTDEKVDKKFGSAFNKLVAFAGGRKNLKPTKVPNDGIAKVLQELYEEDIKIQGEKLKADIRQFVDDYTNFKAETKKAYDAMVKVIKEQKVIFTDRANKLLSSVADIDGFMKSKLDLLKTDGLGYGAALENQEAEEPDGDKEDE